MNDRYILVGHLGTGEGIYWRQDGDLAVEKDMRRLVNPTPEELAEIYITMHPKKEAQS